MNDNNIELKVKHIIAEQLSIDIDNKDIMKESFSLIDDLGADSLDIVEIIMSLEEEFDIEITDYDITTNNTTTVENIIDLVKTKLNKK